ncbi:hypothetical protein DITRI_Ditri01bG0169000 [Diplodiscus trichospermus]
MEGMEIRLEKGDEKSVGLSKYLEIGKIISEKAMNRKGMLNVLRSIWPVELASFVWEVGGNRVDDNEKHGSNRDEIGTGGGD